MKNKFIIRCATICIAVMLTIAPANASAATILKKGSKGNEVTTVQTTLKDMGYYTYSKITGYYGSVTETAVKRFQKENGIAADGIIGKRTMSLLNALDKKRAEAELPARTLSMVSSESTEGTKDSASTGNTASTADATAASGSAICAINSSPDSSGALDWYTQVRYLWNRGEDAVVTDVETGLSFQVKRTYGTNHADVEPLTKEDTAVIKEIWGGFSWERRAVIVQINGYTIAASMTAMPHAGLDSKSADHYVSGRSEGYGWGVNLDKVKNNGCNGVMDIHFKNSRTHTTNIVQKSQQDMVKKAAAFLASII